MLVLINSNLPMKVKIVSIPAKANMQYIRPLIIMHYALFIEQIRYHKAWWWKMSQIERWLTHVSETATDIAKIAI